MSEHDKSIDLIKRLLDLASFEFENYVDGVKKHMEASYRTEDKLAGRVLALEGELREKRKEIINLTVTMYDSKS